MTYVDDQLRHALRRVEPPAGFAERVLQRSTERDIAELTAGRRSRGRSLGGLMVRWAVAAALVVAVTGGVWYRAELRRQAEGEAAKRQVLLGLRIASSKLQLVQLKVNQRHAQ
jgi:hypothetical protein